LTLLLFDRICFTSGLAQPYVCKPLHAFSTLFKAWKTTPRNTWGCLLASSLQQKLNFQVQREDFAILDESKEAVLSCLSSKWLAEANYICSLQNQTSNRTIRGVPQKYNVVRPESCLNYHVNSSSNARSSKSSDLTSL
jgi:hypothetical protein